MGPPSSPDEVEPENLGLHLLAAGWTQGVVFDAPGASYGTCLIQEDGTLIHRPKRAVRSRESLVLASHPCDIRASSERYLEALICRIEDPKSPTVANWDRNSARYFVVEPSTAIVANAQHRVKVEKVAMKSLDHNGVTMDSERLRRFSIWLARRYDRSVVTDELYEAFHRPVFAALDQAATERPTEWTLFNECVSDIRIRILGEAGEQHQVEMLYLVKDREITTQQLAAVEALHQSVRDSVPASDVVSMSSTLNVENQDDVPYGAILRTQSLMLEYPSQEGEGAPPPRWSDDG